MQKPIDVILTSYNRWDLLSRTIDSFLKYNTYPIANFYIYEDFGLQQMSSVQKNEYKLLMEKYSRITWLAGSGRCGHIVALDTLMAHVQTEFYFSIEDDWEFYAPGFIEASLETLEAYPQCLQVWLREHNDTNGHPIIYDGSLKKMRHGYNDIWHGFSFNPSLRRLQDYNIIGSYGQHTSFDRKAPWQSEAVIGRLYAQRGYFASILDQGYVRHIGDNRGIRK